MTDRLIRPSNLGKWSACAKKTYANIVAPRVGRGVNHVSQWVGKAAHAVLAGDQLPDGAAYILNDAITPNLDVAKMQVEEIVSTTRILIAGLGFEPVAWEVPVAAGDVEGTIDVLLKDDLMVPDFPHRRPQDRATDSGRHLGSNSDYISRPTVPCRARILAPISSCYTCHGHRSINRWSRTPS